MKLVIAIPTYQNHRTIGAVVRGAAAHGFPVWVINDGSTDATGGEAAAAGAHVITHAINRGKGEALKTAFAAAAGEGFTHLLSIDGDGQHDPADIPLLVAASQGSEALVLGTRRLEAIPDKNRFGNEVSNFWVNLAMLRFGKNRLKDTQCGLRVYPLAVLPRLRGHGYELETELLIRHARAKRPIASVPVNVYYPPPEERVSHFVPSRDATRIVFLVMRFLFLPRWLWAVFLLAACQKPPPPVPAPPPAVLEPHEQALQQTRIGFSSHQHLLYDGPSGRRESEGLFMVQPGKAYRLRVLGPMAVTLFDVQARCGRFKLDGRDLHATGTLAEAAKAVPFFPVEALFWMLAPLSDGSWQGDQFVSRNGIRARFDEKQKSFVQFADQSGVRMTVRSFTEVQPGVWLPRSLVVDLGPRGKMYIDNDEVSLDVPSETIMAGEVACEAS